MADAAASDAPVGAAASTEFAWTPPTGWIGSGSPGLADEIERTWAQMRDPPLEDVVSAEEKAKLPPLKAAILQLMGLDAPPTGFRAHHFTDWKLLCYLRARGGDVPKSAARAVECIEYLEQGLARLRTYETSASADHRELLRQNMPNGILGKDRRGAGVMYQRMGMWDVPGIGRETGLDTYIAGLWFEVWWSWHLLYQESIAAGVALVGRLYVVDLAGMYLSRAMRNISYGKQITATFPGKEHPIPEGMSKCIVTNAPWYVERVWSALKYSGVIPARTLAKVSIFSDEAKFLAELSKHVDLDQVPSLFGGSSAAPWPFAEGGDVPNGAGTSRGRAPAAAPASAP